MNYILLWIFLLILQAFVTSLPIQSRYDISVVGVNQQSGQDNTSPDVPKYEDTSNSGNEQVISVRITSSVAVGRGKEKSPYRPSSVPDHGNEMKQPLLNDARADKEPTTLNSKTENSPPNLLGANIEYLRQLNVKKDAEPVHPFNMAHGQRPNENESNHGSAPQRIEKYNENIHDVPMARKVPSSSDTNNFLEQKQNRNYETMNVNGQSENYDYFRQNNLRKDSQREPFSPIFHMDVHKNIANKTDGLIKGQQMDKQEVNSFISNDNNDQTDDSIAESSIKSIEFAKSTGAVPPSTSYIRSTSNGPINEKQNNPGVTTVNFNIVHDGSRLPKDNERSNSYITSGQITPNQQQFYASPKIYSKPSKIYSEPSKFYSEPAKIYSEPAKIYSEPAKVYSEPSKIYSEPAKFYSEPASLHLDQNVPNLPPLIDPNFSAWQGQNPHHIGSTAINTTPITAITNALQGNAQSGNQPNLNYDINGKDTVAVGREDDPNTEKCKDDNCQVGYVVEGRQYKKYRVEERTSDGFIVGEYGVVRNEDGALRGVRYTADSDASPRLIHDALMKFLQLK